MNNTELTRAELEIMQILWMKSNVFLSDVVEAIEEPRPAYTTVSTVIRTLVKKGFVTFDNIGKMHCYYPTISKEEYTYFLMHRVNKRFFDGSFSNMISFFNKKNIFNENEKSKLLNMLNNSN